MNFSRLEKNLFEIVRENQLKLGYCKETMRLYYPLLSLNRLLAVDFDEAEMLGILHEFCIQIKDRIGRIGVTSKKERFCFEISPDVSEYIHLHGANSEFLQAFIHMVSHHDVHIEDVIGVFKKYSDQVHVEHVSHGEFDYLVYFEDGQPDDFRYCLTDEGCHMIYHRYTMEDYEDFKFDEI